MLYILFFLYFLSTTHSFYIKSYFKSHYTVLYNHLNDDIWDDGEVPWIFPPNQPTNLTKNHHFLNEYNFYYINKVYGDLSKSKYINNNREKLTKKQIQRKKNQTTIFFIYLLTFLSIIDYDQDKKTLDILYYYLNSNKYYLNTKKCTTFFIAFLFSYFKTVLPVT